MNHNKRIDVLMDFLRAKTVGVTVGEIQQIMANLQSLRQEEKKEEVEEPKVTGDY